MTIKLFVKRDCPRCPAAKKAVEGVEGVEIYSVDEVDGLAEASFYGVLATPTVLVLDDTDREVAAWRGQAPDRSVLIQLGGAAN
jgi:glutaredoxin